MNIDFVNIFDKRKIEEIFRPFLYKTDEFHSLDFQREIVMVFKKGLPEIYDLTQKIKEKLLLKPYFITVKGLNFNSLQEDIRDLFILAFTSSFGYSTPTDKVNKKVLWPVRAELNPAVKNLTFSQKLGEAEYHTDTQYFENPEELFSLWCVVPDKNKQGVNGLIRADYIIDEINGMVDGRKVIETLSKTEFPFRVPSVFTTDGSDSDVEYFLGPILSEKPKIRYRKETIDKGVIASGIKLSNDQRYAISVVESILNNPKEEIKNFLDKGEVIFVNNHELLHNRSNYNDPNRFLIRVRIKI